MTLKTEVPISIEHKIRRVYHQHHHHHHYHLHHTLDHHHLHIHNQAVHQSHIASERHHYLLPVAPQTTRVNELSPTTTTTTDTTAQPAAIAAPQTSPPTLAIEQARSITQHSHSSAAAVALRNNQHNNQHLDQLQSTQQANNSSLQAGHQLMQASGLTHLIARHNQREQRILATSHGQQNHHRSTVRSKQRSQIQFVLLSAFAYILSPIDLIPEAIFGIFGILDDLVFLFVCLFCVAIILLYPIFLEMRRTMLDKLGLKHKTQSSIMNT